MARLSNTADERHKSGEDEDKDEDSEAAEVVMSADLRSRIDSLKKLISSGNLVEEYDEIESLFKSELPTHNFDSYLGSRSIHHVSKLRTARPRCEPKLALLREKWNLDEAAFIKHFNEDMMGSCRFVELLVKLADIATLSEALLVLHQKQQLRTSGQHRQPGVNQTALWQPVDAQNALAEFTAQGLCSQPKPMTHKRKRDQVVASDIGEPASPLPCTRKVTAPPAQARRSASVPTKSLITQQHPAQSSPPKRRSLTTISSTPRSATPKQLLQQAAETDKHLDNCIDSGVETEWARSPARQRPSEVFNSNLLNDVSYDALDDTVDAESTVIFPEETTIGALPAAATPVSVAQELQGELQGPSTPPPASQSSLKETHDAICSSSPKAQEDRKALPTLPPSDSTSSLTLLTTDKAGALSALAHGKWLSATAVDLVLDLFQTKGFRTVDNTFPSILRPARLDEENLRVKADEHTLVKLLLQSHHWTVAFTDLRTGVVEHLDSLQGEGTALLNTTRAALERLTAPLSRQDRFKHLQWTFAAKACAQQDNIDDCGVYMLVAILHRMAGLPEPQLVDAGLWRKAFRAALGGEGASVQSAAAALPSSSVSIFGGLSVPQDQPRDESGLDPVTAQWSHTHALIDDRYNSFRCSLQRAHQAHKLAQDADTLLYRFADMAELSRLQLAQAIERKRAMLRFHKQMHAKTQEFRKSIPTYGRSTDSGTEELEHAAACYGAPSSEAIEGSKAEIEKMVQEEKEIRHRKDGILAAKSVVEGEVSALATRARELEEVMKRATAELHAFYKLQMSIYQERIEMLQANKIPPL